MTNEPTQATWLGAAFGSVALRSAALGAGAWRSVASGIVALSLTACDSEGAGPNPTPTGDYDESSAVATTTTSVAAPSSETMGLSVAFTSTPGETSQSAGTGDESTADACIEEITIPEGSTGRVDLPFAVFSGATQLEMGSDITVEGSQSYAVTLLGMFLTAPRLEAEDGTLVDAVFLDLADRPLPYGLFFYHSDTPVTSLRLAAPPGNYRALQLHFGPPDACLGSIRNTPLNPDSEMYWSWGATFLALRLEGRSQAGDAGAFGFSFHLGPLPGAPLDPSNIRVEHALTVGTQAAPGPELRFDVNKVLFPHPADVSLSGHFPVADWAIANAVTRAFELAP